MNLLILLWWLHHVVQALTNLCPSEEWLQYQTNCYLFMNQKVDWFVARNSCATYNAHMLRIDSSGVNKFIHETLYANGPRSIWIGANDIDSDGVFVWENSGDPVRYTDWSLDSPSNTTDIQSCARLKAGEGWKDISCTKLVKYVCQANVPLDDRTEQVPGSGQESSSIMVAMEDMEPTSPSNTEHITRKALTNLCPSEEWLQYQTTCYLFMHEQVDWFFAKNSCATNNAHMLRIDNTAVNTFIHSILYVYGPRYVWTGANDLDSDGVFVWEDSGDPANYTDWTLNSPRKNNDFPRCARLKLGEGWNDIACTNLVKYVCQTKVHLDDRTEQVPESGRESTSITPATEDLERTSSGEFDSTGHVEASTGSPDAIVSTFSNMGHSNGSTAYVTSSSQTTDHGYCLCCNKTNDTQLTTNQKQDIITQLRGELSVSKANTSASRRKFVSVYDSRPSSVAMGTLGCFLLVLAIGSIVVSDMMNAIAFFYKRANRKKIRSEI